MHQYNTKYVDTQHKINVVYFRAKLKLHTKPVGILNTLNYYGGILEWVC